MLEMMTMALLVKEELRNNPWIETGGIHWTRRSRTPGEKEGGLVWRDFQAVLKSGQSKEEEHRYCYCGLRKTGK